MFKCKKFTIIYGHYGCGKTNLSLNLALMLAREGNPVTLVDLDIVNPYFRSSDYKGLFEGLDVEVVSPQFAGTNLDLPSLPAEIYSVFNQAGRYVIMDIGGDDAGAYALGRFAGQIESLADYEAYYVVNKYRALTQSPQEAARAALRNRGGFARQSDGYYQQFTFAGADHRGGYFGSRRLCAADRGGAFPSACYDHRAERRGAGARRED